jgi:hypothetical protein
MDNHSLSALQLIAIARAASAASGGCLDELAFWQ